MELISRQQAIDAVEFGITYARAFNKETGEVKELFKESNDELRKAVERIRQLPPIQPEPHWIPVTERLPVEEGHYLVCGKKGGIYHANYRGRWWTQVGCGGKLVPSVVAWCELPEPYKEVTE